MQHANHHCLAVPNANKIASWFPSIRRTWKLDSRNHREDPPPPGKLKGNASYTYSRKPGNFHQLLFTLTDISFSHMAREGQCLLSIIMLPELLPRLTSSTSFFPPVINELLPSITSWREAFHETFCQ